VTDTIKESLSALIDGEASEIEVHRLVREFRSDEALSETWAVFQQVRATVRTGGEQVGGLSPDRHRQLLNRISVAVGAEEEHALEVAERSSSPRIVMGSLALAASLVVAVFIGVKQPETPGSVAQLPASTPVEVQTASVDTALVDTAPVDTVQPQASELVELDEEKQRRLRAYLNQHDRMARMNASEQQMVNYKEPSGR